MRSNCNISELLKRPNPFRETEFIISDSLRLITPSRAINFAVIFVLSMVYMARFGPFVADHTTTSLIVTAIVVVAGWLAVFWYYVANLLITVLTAFANLSIMIRFHVPIIRLLSIIAAAYATIHIAVTILYGINDDLIRFIALGSFIILLVKTSLFFDKKFRSKDGKSKQKLREIALVSQFDVINFAVGNTPPISSDKSHALHLEFQRLTDVCKQAMIAAYGHKPHTYLVFNQFAAQMDMLLDSDQKLEKNRLQEMVLSSNEILEATIDSPQYFSHMTKRPNTVE